MPSRPRFALRVEGLPLRLFGYRREDVRRWVEDLEAQDEVALRAHQDAVARQEAALARTAARRRTLEEILAHLTADTARLRDQVQRMRESAVALQEGARREADRLRAGYEGRLDEIRQAVPEVEDEIRRVEAELDALLAATGAAMGLDQPLAGDRQARDHGSAQALSEMAVAIFGPDIDLDGLQVRELAQDLFRTEAPLRSARVQTRSGELLGDLSALILFGRNLVLIGYEVAKEGIPQGAIPASDVVAVRRQTVIVGDTYRLLDAPGLPREESYTLVAIGSGPGRPRPEDDASDEKDLTPDAPTAPEAPIAPPPDPFLSPGPLGRGDAMPPAAASDIGQEGPGDRLLPAAWLLAGREDDSTYRQALDESPAPKGTDAQGDAAVPPVDEGWTTAPAPLPTPLPAWPDPAWDLRHLERMTEAASAPLVGEPEDGADELTPPPADVWEGGVAPIGATDAAPQTLETQPAPPTGADIFDDGFTAGVPLPTQEQAAASEHAATVESGCAQWDAAGEASPPLPLGGTPEGGLAPAPGSAEAESGLWIEDGGDVLPPPAWGSAEDDVPVPTTPDEPTAAPAFASAPAPAPARPARPAARSEEPAAGLGKDVLMFLEGKIVGTDIYDASGNLLAAAGTPIDSGLVARAEAAGKLPDLIVYMTLPE